MKKVLITSRSRALTSNKVVTSHFFIMLSKLITRTSFSRQLIHSG